jgi:hypothetical protein
VSGPWDIDQARAAARQASAAQRSAEDFIKGAYRTFALAEEAYRIAEGVVEAAKQAGWRASKDRDDVQAFIGWSQRREFAEAGVGA